MYFWQVPSSLPLRTNTAPLFWAGHTAVLPLSIGTAQYVYTLSCFVYICLQKAELALTNADVIPQKPQTFLAPARSVLNLPSLMLLQQGMCQQVLAAHSAPGQHSPELCGKLSSAAATAPSLGAKPFSN